MSITLLSQVASHLVANLPTDIPIPTPQAPPGAASNVASTLLGYTMWGALTLCGLAALAAGGLLAVGHMSGRPHLRERGTSSLIAALAGAIVIGIAIPLVNTFVSIT